MACAAPGTAPSASRSAPPTWAGRSNPWRCRPATNLTAAKLESDLKERKPAEQPATPSRLAWLRRCQAGHQLDVQCLRLGRSRILHLPGELFVEYQLAAKAMRPDLFVAMAAYGDYAPWYIGTEVAYEQGGYETGPDASNVAPEAEAVLMAAIRKLLVPD